MIERLERASRLVAQAQMPVVNWQCLAAKPIMLARMSNERRIASITRRAKGHAAPRDYRIFRLDASGQITGSDLFPAEDDAVALAIARAMEGSADRELWEAERLIARLPAIP